MRVPLALILLSILVVNNCSVAFADSQIVNMNIVNCEVREVLTALADISNVNVVVDDSVEGKISIQLKNTSFENALELITKTKGLVYQKVNDVIIIASPREMGKGFGVVHYFKLSYANPNDIIDIVGVMFPDLDEEKYENIEDGSQIKSELATERQSNGKKASKFVTTDEKAAKSKENKQSDKKQKTEIKYNRIKIDEATNTIIFHGTTAEAAKIQKLLIELDIPYQQIALEAEVVAINKESTKDVGIEWSWELTPQWPDVQPEKATFVSDGKGSDQPQVEPRKVTRESRKGIIQFGRTPEGYPYEFYYQAKINALVSNGNAKILARPKITTINGKKAQILIGDRIPVLIDEVENGKTKTTIDYVESGIKLIYTPRINKDGQITANVRTEVSSPTLVPEMKAYRITTREAETTVRLKDGETMVIGGLMGSIDNETKRAVPFLSDLPVLGALFKNYSKTKTDTEVVIFLTSRVVK